jgi:uncharacterized RDD family membrane protein YckC
MYCPTCGSPTDSTFCSTCGTNISSVSTNDSQGVRKAAGFWRRGGATLVDGLVVGIPASIIVVIINPTNASYKHGVPISQYLLTLLLVGLYQVRMLARPTGQTIGDRVAKIKIIDLASGGQLTNSQSLKRWLASAVMNLLSAFLLVGVLDVLWCLWDKEGQTLHDKFAGTTAIRVE